MEGPAAGRQPHVGPLDLTWFATGNNCQLRADTGRRTAHVRLETPVERPELETGFKHPQLRQHVRRHRGRLLSAALTLLRGWHVAGRPAGGLAAWGSFEGWSDMVRGCLVWAGQADPADARQELLGRADRDAGALGEFLRALVRIDPGRRGRTAAELTAVAEADPAVRAAVVELCGGLDAKAVGYKLRGFARRVVAGLYLDHAGESGGVVRWAAFPAAEFATRR